MPRIIERIEARELPFGKTHEWHPARVTLQYDCSEKLILTATSTSTACGRCDADVGAAVRDLREREGDSPDELSHPWLRRDLLSRGLALALRRHYGGCLGTDSALLLW